jgi:hypothetical protein
MEAESGMRAETTSETNLAPSAAEAAALPRRAVVSAGPLSWSAGRRVALAVAAVALLWGAVIWALA